MKNALLFVAACALSISASAQVHRCTDASGKLSFSDTPCAASQKGGLIQNAPSADSVVAEREQAANARERFLAQQYREEQPERDRQAALRATQERQKTIAAERSRRVVCSNFGYTDQWGNSSGTSICRER